MSRLKSILVNICRLLLAITFIFSGFVKAIDPLGSQYKIGDYLTALGMAGKIPEWVQLILSISLSGAEFTLGILLLLAIRRRLVSKLAFVLMLGMTLITLWLTISNPIQDCGCFGDAIHLTNSQTFIKNLVLLVASIVVMRLPLYQVRFISKTNQWIATYFTMIFIVIVSLLSLYHLPLFDFRPYYIGQNILKGMQIPKGAKQTKYKTTFICTKNGVQKEFNENNYPYNDSTWVFVDTKQEVIEKGYEPPIHDFSITDEKTGEDLTEQILNKDGYTFLLVSPMLEVAQDRNFGDIEGIYEYAKENGYAFYGLTASTDKGIKHWRDITGAEYPFYVTDGTTLKTMIRSNPGLLLLYKGTIINKWNHNDIPKVAELNAPLNLLTIGHEPESSTWKKILTMILCYVLPLILLIVADRFWAWTKWVQKREKWIKEKEQRLLKNEQSKKLYQLLKRKRNMRKKIVAGNWKMNETLQEGVALAKEINDALKADKPNCDVVICTPFIHLASIADVLDKELVKLGAENCADKEKGAYTGEVSAAMVKSTGAEYVILGHSERRQYYGETAEILKEKVELALANGLKIIFCCGETLEEREANKQNEVVKAELEGSVFHLSAEAWKNIILAYEPIWAIGTGKTATSDQAEEMLAYIRSIVAEKYGKDAASETSILYGGSCKASNAPELFSKPNIDGGLIGGASLKAADFKGIIDAWKK
ncbi:MAG: triose-phosphate isomerase [Prevotella pallens]|jgi:triose-phosphate isomerase|uniref:BT_3928 family protein n=1 Tax=Prevotella pallens TaxID=60133 RepID=UPI001CAC4F8A|nr:BT_3928 family protein [Prevotella pallens]MBF1442430.1 triose-phosphate isomerase [Prevotella pallens]MBF1451776.1 triose-phosphate isomerase [Prevotella pallens]MBF1458901.1 triose-phosphate isomerase [Prevotella pallens]MBF1464860.1 triose-phosphate isomerase [Prevotella pallens]MBF1476356.1 triose-phosphate isomerase [Prevotella pallens]